MELRTDLLVLFHVYITCVVLSSAKDYFKIGYEWRRIEYDFPNDKERKEAIKNGTFKAGNSIPTDVQVYYPDCCEATKIVFIATPRMSDGIPVTFGTVTDKFRNLNPVIKPYPDWEWQTNPEMCKKKRMVSIYRSFIDECSRLWLIDNGKVGEDQVCPPQILAFDLKTNSLVYRYEVPFDQHLNTSLYITPIAEIQFKNCEETFVYIADSDKFSMLVYDVKNNKSWRILDATFKPDPKYENYTIGGMSFKLLDGIFGMTLSPPSPDRKLFYHAMTAGTESWIYTRDLKNQSLFSNLLNASQKFNTLPGGRKTQSASEAMDKSGSMYFSLLNAAQIARWNMKDPYDNDHFEIVGDNPETMQFPTGVKVTTDKNREEILWILDIPYQKLANGITLSPNEINFIISFARIKDFEAHEPY